MMIPTGSARLHRFLTTLLLTVAVWVSALPVVLLLVIPRVGIGPAIPIAGGLLGGIFLLCWGLSVPERPDGR